MMEITYSEVLLYFIFPPLILFAVFFTRQVWAKPVISWKRANWLPLVALITHVFLAVIYTTPWDNYLLATSVWWYDKGLVTGLKIGLVPIEEYTFFVVQTLLTGLWVLALWRIRALQPNIFTPRKSMRYWSMVGTVIIWSVSVVVLASGWQPGRYLALIMVWALIPLFLQLGFGADILWDRRLLLLFAFLPPTIYLWIVDAIAIRSGVWIIDPRQTLGLKLNPLPIEEMVFFLVTNVMISFGITLMIAPESNARFLQIIKRVSMVFGWKRVIVKHQWMKAEESVDKGV